MSKHAIKVDPTQLPEQVTRVIDNLKSGVNPDKVVCMMGIVVSKDDSNPIDDNGKPMVELHHFVLGDPDDIRKMMVFMIENSFEMPEEDESDTDFDRVH